MSSTLLLAAPLPAAVPDAVAVALVVLATLGIGVYGLRVARTTSDLMVASRSVPPLLGASAVSGEYLSAASFLGIAGLVLVLGVDALWYPVGFVAGYLVLLLLVAAPLRRSGAYTLPDFAEARFASVPLRRLCSALVVLIGWLYLVPQLQGAGLTLQLTTGAPAWAGAALVAVVVVGGVSAGGMRSATFVQAFQYWLKLTALAVPALVLVIAWRADGAPGARTLETPAVAERTTVRIDTDVRVQAQEPTPVLRDGEPVVLRGEVTLPQGTTLVLPAGTTVPHLVGLEPARGVDWARPLSGAGGVDHPLYAVYALVLATFLGTMGLPHVLVRFYTNPDGRAARRTALAVLALLGAFYLLPAVYGFLGRLYAPELLLTGRTDAVVLALPVALVPGLGGQLLQALLVAGAFAAFLSTSSGLLVSTAGVLVQDVLRRSRPRDFRRAAALAGVVPLALALPATDLPLGQVVGLAFALAASTFCPLLVLGIWWRGLTAVGAAAGLVVGGGLCTAAVLVTLLDGGGGGWRGALLGQPAAWTVPTAFAVMGVVSRATRSRVPAGTERFLLRLHAPESLRAR